MKPDKPSLLRRPSRREAPARAVKPKKQLDNLTGHVQLELTITAETLPAQLVCRLCDVAPDGRSNLIIRTAVNLGLDDALDDARNASPGAPFQAKVTFPSTCYRIAPGHRLRLVLAGSYWPLVWPIEQGDLHVSAGKLSLPHCTLRQKNSPFPSALDLPTAKRWEITSQGAFKRHNAEQLSGWTQPEVTMRFEDIDVTMRYSTSAVFTLDPVQARYDYQMQVTRPDGIAEVKSHVTLTHTSSGPVSQAALQASWNGEQIHQASSTKALSGPLHRSASTA